MTTSFQAADTNPWIYKDPDAVLDYTVDWAFWLDTDTISSVTWVLDTGIALDSQVNTETSATVWLSGGTDGAGYGVTCRISTAGGRTDDRTFRVLIRQR